MTKIKTHNPVCHLCGEQARIYHLKKWWCHNNLEAEGYCSNVKTKKNDKG